MHMTPHFPQEEGSLVALANLLHLLVSINWSSSLRNPRDTRADPKGSMTSLDPLLHPTRSFKRTLWFSRICQPVFTFLQKTFSKNPQNIMKDFVDHCGTLPGLRGPSLTFMDTKMDPYIDTARLILGAPWWKRGLQGPSMVQIDTFFLQHTNLNLRPGLRSIRPLVPE